MKRFLLTCAAVVCLSTPASAMSGNELLGHCKNSSYYAQGLCMGFIQGVGSMAAQRTKIERARMDEETDVETIIWYKTMIKFGGVCIPKNVTLGQLEKIVVRYLERHPNSLHVHAMTLTNQALAKAFPCNL